VEGLSSGDISPNDIKDMVQNATKQKFDKTGEVNTLSRSAQRKKQQTKITNPPTPPPSLVNSTEQSTPMELNKMKNENSDNEEEEQQQPINSSDNIAEDLATMDLSAFCLAAKRDNIDDNEQKTIINGTEEQSMVIKSEPNDELNNKRDLNENNDDDNLPLDLSCSKSKRSCEEDYWKCQHTQAAYPLPSTRNKYDQFKELNDLATTAILLNNIKQENILDLTNTNQILSKSIKQESSLSTNNFKQIEQTIREKFQYPQPLPIPDGKFCFVILYSKEFFSFN